MIPDSDQHETVSGDKVGQPELSNSIREPVDEQFSSVYAELRALAGAVLQRSRPIDGTCATSLVHDAYVRLSGRGLQFRDRAHFLCLAAKAMRYRAARGRGRPHTSAPGRRYCRPNSRDPDR